MPPLAVNLKSYQVEISQHYLAGDTPDQIALSLAGKYNIHTSACTVRRRLHQ